MLRLLSMVFVGLLVLSVWVDFASVAEAEDQVGKPATPVAARPLRGGVDWHTSYATATDIANREGKMIFVYFYDPGENELCDKFESEALSDPQVLKKLTKVVRVKLPIDAKIRSDGEDLALLKHHAFAEMLGQPGVAMLDHVHKDAEYYGCVVSTFPFMEGRPYSVQQLGVILDLPPGTLTQRTLIYAVRVHPERPASTKGKLDAYLVSEARRHSQYQADIHLQGHHHWETRFHQINTKLPSDLLACEVCAESWPGENLVEAAIECVRCWRFSEGHWSAVKAEHRFYGYDMKRGSNGIWYGTGLFGQRR